MWESEDDFIASFITEFRDIYFGFHIWPKITSIGGVETRPELDLVDIDPLDRKIIGWEFKLLRLNARNYSAFYSGIGQALCYFRYGLDQVYLVIGLSEDISYEEYNENWVGMINTIGHIFTYTINNNRFKIITYSRAGNIIDIKLFPPYAITGRYTRPKFQIPGYIDYAELSRENLFAGMYNQEKGRNFLERYHLEGY